MTRRSPALRTAAILAVLILVPGLVGSVYLARLDPAVVKARVAQEVQRATGRDLAIGTMRLHLLPDLTIDADDVALANPAGFSRPTMISARHVHARVALLPLLAHHVVIREISLAGPDLKLERLADGEVNWRFGAPQPSARLPDATAHGDPGHMRLDSLTLLDVTIADGAVSWSLPGGGGALVVPGASLREVNASSTMHLFARVIVAGESVTLTGRFGGQSHLWHAADRSPWPVALTVAAQGGTLDLSGSITAPRLLAGYDVTIAGHGPDLGQLAALWPGIPVPRLRDVTLDARVVDRDDGIDLPRLDLVAGASDLSASIPGLVLERLAITAPNIDGGNGTLSNHVAATGRYAGQALAVDATLGPIGRLFGRGQVTARAPIRLDGTVEAAGARLIVQGRVEPMGDWRGTDAAVQATIPDLALLSPLAGRALPNLHDVALAGTVQSARGDLVLHDGHLVSPVIDVRIDGSARLAGRPRMAGRVTVARVDLDALMASLPPAAPALPPIVPQAPASSPLPVAATLISDRPFDLAWLRTGDLDATVSIGTLVRHGVSVNGVAGRVVLALGRLAIDPFTATLSGTPVAATLSVDAAAATPAMALVASAGGLDLGRVLALLGLSDDGAGRLDLNAALTGRGASPHAVAGTLGGHLGIALTGGQIDNRLLAAAIGALVPATRFGFSLPRTGRSAISCAATRIDFSGGVGVPRAFLLDLDRLRLTASGAIDAGAETFALRLRPVIRLGRAELALPSRVDGSWLRPTLGLEPASGAASAATIAAGLLGGHSHDAGALLAGLAEGADSLLADADTGDCGPALAAARDPSRAAAPPAAVAATPAASPSPRQRAIDLLRRLFKRAG